MSNAIRPARITDVPGMLALIKELAQFEREPHAVEVTERDLERDGFGEDPKYKCFVAVERDRVIGMALCYDRYSTWKGPALHLEDLIVTADRRGLGIGTALLDEVIKYASELRVKRVSWEVLDWNDPAIEFYEQKGARVLRDWDVVHLNEEAISAYLKAL